MVDKVNATRIAKEMAPELKIDGELVDLPLFPALEHLKHRVVVQEKQRIGIPTLEVGNIAYKLVQRMANAEAVGQSCKEWLLLSTTYQGCSIDDIVSL